MVSSNCINSFSLSGSQGISTPVNIPDSTQASIVSVYFSNSKSRKWKRISSKPASAKSFAHSALNGILVYMCKWKSLPNSFLRILHASKTLSLAITGSPPVIPAPVAFIARASSITASQSPISTLRSFANIQSISRRFSESGQ